MKSELPELLHADVTGSLIEAFYTVYRDLGYGFIERVYENAMAIAARALGLVIQQQLPIRVHYLGTVVGKYSADLVANNLVIVELKAAKELMKAHEAQLLNYLKATRYEVGLLVNFGPRPQHKRKVYENRRKGTLSWTNDDAEERSLRTPATTIL
jgi:GxxExxY protein